MVLKKQGDVWITASGPIATDPDHTSCSDRNHPIRSVIFGAAKKKNPITGTQDRKTYTLLD